MRKSERLLSLDVARGIAALCVVFFHWSHFFLVSPEALRLSTKPLADIFGLLYRHGGDAVEFFFVLSGCIFFMKYGEAIASGRINGWRFFVLRFSRLYPLQFASLLLAAALQWVALIKFGDYLIYKQNDGVNFILNLLFMQTWFYTGASFNMPSWSVSIEVFLYCVFFFSVRYLPQNILFVIVLAIFGLWLKQFNYNPFGRGLWCFFIGGAAGLICLRLTPMRRSTSFVLLTTLALIILTAAQSYIGTLSYGLAIVSGLTINAESTRYFLLTLSFAAIVASLVLIEDTLSPIMEKLSWLGDISYSSIMLHFPLQLLFIIVSSLLIGYYDARPFQSPWMLLVFFMFLIPLSLVCYRSFEVPAQRTIRDTVLNPRRAGI